MYDPTEMVTLVRDHLGPTFARRGVTARIIAPDTAHWPNAFTFVDAFVKDPAALQYVSVFATHPYPEGNAPINLNFTAPRDAGRELWESEVSQENIQQMDVPDPSMTSAITLVKMMHDHLSVSNVNAWNWWALRALPAAYADDPQRKNPALMQEVDGVMVKFKRGYVLGNYSKFVRPGFARVDALPASSADVLVTAYNTDTRLVIVAANTGVTPVTRSFDLQAAGARADGTLRPIVSITPWVTSDTLSLEAQPALPVATTFSGTLPERSVTSFVIDYDPTAIAAPPSTTGSTKTTKQAGPCAVASGQASSGSLPWAVVGLALGFAGLRRVRRR
jgi:glucuronoarabinoxylan endo-1,4-beta-xylanase